MKKYLLNIILFAGLVSFAACSDDNNKDEVVITPTVTTEGVYVINEGVNGSNSELSYYNKENLEVTSSIFSKKNNSPLGDGAQDLLIYGSKMYISVTKSENIYVTDLNAKLLKYDDGSIAKIKSDEVVKDLSQPRSLVAHEGYVYASYYSGHIVKIDTTSMKVVATLSDNYKYLEEMTIVSNKLYVTESRDKNNRVAVINLDNFKLEAPITVAANPSAIASDILGYIYTLSTSDWTTYTLSKIKDNKVIETHEVKASEMSMVNNELIFMHVTYGAEEPKFYSYDIYKKELTEKSLLVIKDENIKKQSKFAYKLSVDPVNKDIYISTTDFMTDGNSVMLIFDKSGNYKNSFKTGGIAPSKARFIITEK